MPYKVSRLRPETLKYGGVREQPHALADDHYFQCAHRPAHSEPGAPVSYSRCVVCFQNETSPTACRSRKGGAAGRERFRCRG
jgi:hypothetical protein